MLGAGALVEGFRRIAFVYEGLYRRSIYLECSRFGSFGESKTLRSRTCKACKALGFGDWKKVVQKAQTLAL